MYKFFALLLIAGSVVQVAYSFGSGNVMRRIQSKILMAVDEISSTTALDQIIAGAGTSLIVIDYSTTWCGPCKVVLPKYMELSEKYGSSVKFLKCIGDTSAEASQLMKREGVRSVPSFHFWKSGAKIEVVNGARIEEVESAIKANQ